MGGCCCSRLGFAMLVFAVRWPPTKGHGNLSNKHEKVRLKIRQMTHTHTLISWSMTGSLLMPDAGSQGPRRSIPDVRSRATCMRAYCKYSQTCSPASQQGFSQWQGRVSRRGHDLSAWSLHVFAGPLWLHFPPAVWRLIGDSESSVHTCLPPHVNLVMRWWQVRQPVFLTLQCQQG